MLQEIFKEVKYSECEEKQKIEQGIIYNWINILDEVKSGVVKEFIQIDITPGVKKERNAKVKLEDVLFFRTRRKFLSSDISNGTILFNHQTEEGGLKLELAYIPLSPHLPGDTVATISDEISLKTSYNLRDSDKNRFSLCFERRTRKLQH